MGRRTSSPPARTVDSVLAPAPPAGGIPIVLYTRAACHLCEEMKAQLARAGLLPPGALREVDVDLDPVLAARYGNVVPVLEIGGRVAWRARIRPGTLHRRYARLVERYRRAGPGSGARTYSADCPASAGLSATTDSVPTASSALDHDMPAADSSAPTLRVLLVDDHELVRSALAGAIAQQAGFEVACVASDASEALPLLDECAPDLVVMDIDLPGRPSFDAVRRMRELRPELRVIFLSGFCHDSTIEQALAVGARGYVMKGGPLEDLYEALRQVARGGEYFSPAVRARILTDASGARRIDAPTTRLATLTERELEVLRFLARGLSKKEIARTLQLSVKTVEHHAAGLMRKLDIHDRVELTRYAIREGLAEA